MNIYLASKSPRRRELLTQMEISFDLLLVDTPELVAPGESPQAYSKRITHEKMMASWNKITEENLKVMPVLCADTEVILDQKILGKPQDKQDAFNMLKSYANRTHQVITSVGLIYHDYQKIMMDTTLVTFSTLSDDEINHYLASDNYKDKSGSYGIQSYIGQFISHIDGCFYSVMGLPLNTVRELLQDFKKHSKAT
jgi:septum formation protein